MIQTSRQIAPMTQDSCSPKSSSFCFRGDTLFSFCLEASWIFSLILPTSVDMPMEVTIPFPEPPATTVPAKAMFLCLARRGSSAVSGIAWWSLNTGSGSPVSADSSQRRVAVPRPMMRISAGTFSPIPISTMSPGTNSDASICIETPSRMTCASSGWRRFNAARAFSAFSSCQTPTQALMMRMRKMTNGSTKAVSASSPSSKQARMKETTAETRRIFTRRSSNCSKISSNKDVGSSSSSELEPYFSRAFLTPSAVNPFERLDPKPFATSPADL
mmetsp:Transcript_14926/g.26811  ORF Transcript_14926/g.26811 Transcript_14926/m.26811 type:complete len:273 (+) Transcript_14926:2668-3486(+)